MSNYRVTIYYREPTYPCRGDRAPYRFTYAIVARTVADACAQAVTEFKTAARLSSVGWVREIVAIVPRQAVAS